MKKIIYYGSTTDGYEYFGEVGKTSAGGQTYRRKVGEFYMEPTNAGEPLRREDDPKRTD